MQSWLEGINWVGRCAQATGMTASLRILSSKADSNTWESFTRSELKLESLHQESPRSDIFRKRATKLISFSSRTWHLPTLPKVPKAGSMTMVLLCLIGQQTQLTWTPSRIYGVLSRGKWETPDPTKQMISKQPGLPLHLSSATGWSPPCHAALMQ